LIRRGASAWPQPPGRALRNSGHDRRHRFGGPEPRRIDDEVRLRPRFVVARDDFGPSGRNEAGNIGGSVLDTAAMLGASEQTISTSRIGDDADAAAARHAVRVAVTGLTASATTIWPSFKFVSLRA